MSRAEFNIGKDRSLFSTTLLAMYWADFVFAVVFPALFPSAPLEPETMVNREINKPHQEW